VTASDVGSVARMRRSGRRTDRIDESALSGPVRPAGFVRGVRTPEPRDVTFREVPAKGLQRSWSTAHR
jgi:hypothetical protein